MMKKIPFLFAILLFTSISLTAQETSTSDDEVALSADLISKYNESADSELYLKDDLLLSTNFSLSHGADKSFGNGVNLGELRGFDAIGFIQGGYFFADKIAVGLGVILEVAYVDLPGLQETTAVELFGGPFIRYYFIDKLFVQVLGGYGIQNSKLVDGTTIVNDNYNGFYGQGGLGYDIFLNDNSDIALQLGVGYAYKQLTNSANNQLEIKSGKMNYNVGIVFYFF